jgi:predicted permease
METLLQDSRYSVRMLAKAPGFATVAVLTLALGIGASTAIFSLIDGVILRSLPVRDPNQLVILQWRAHNSPEIDEYSSFGDCGESGISGPSGCSFPLPIFEQIRSQTNAFSSITAFAGPAALDLSGNGPASIVEGEIVSGDYFSTLGVNAAVGRTLSPSDDSLSASPAAVLSYAYWQSAFGGSRSVLGRTILLNNVAFTIVGVADTSFTNLSPGKTQDLWLTIAMVPRLGISWGRKSEGLTNWWLLIMARLKPGVSLAQAQTAASLAFRNEVLYGPKPLSRASDEPTIVATRAQEGLVGQRGQLSRTLYLLTFAVGIILVIACANVAGLLLSRAATRQKEIAVRLALGAGRATILRQLLTESVLLSLLGGVFGIIFAYWGVHAITTLMIGGSSSRFPYVIAPDWRVLSFALGVSILTGIAFGLAPAFRSTRVDLAPALKENASTVPGSATRIGRFHLGTTLVVAQVALSVLVLIGAGLLVRTLENLRNINPGFDTHNVLLFEIDPTLLGYKDAQIENLYRELRNQLAALPGVTSVSYSSDALLSGGRWTETVHVEGQPQKPDVEVDMFASGPEFFETMHIPLLEGRMFTLTDFEQAAQTSAATKAAEQNANPQSPTATTTAAVATGPPAAAVSVLVNEAFVRRYFANENPLGKRIMHTHGHSASTNSFDTSPKLRNWQIVGVVTDTKYDTLRRTIQPMVYVPFTSGGTYFELRAALDPRALIPTVRSVADKINNNVPLSHIRTQTQVIDELLSQERMVARLSGFFGVVALVLACIGLYGLLSYEVSRRTREIGIRVALGAQQRDVLRLVVGLGILLAIVGAAVGIGVALAVTRYLSSMLYDVHANDPVTIIAAAVLLALVAMAACYIPARRATRVDPMVALRYE